LAFFVSFNFPPPICANTDELEDEDIDWALIDNMEDVAPGMGLVAADKEAPADFTARQAFCKKILRAQQQEYQASAQEQLQERQDEIKAILERHHIKQGAEKRGGRRGKKGDTSITATNPAPSSRSRKHMDAREKIMQDALYQQKLHLQQAYDKDLAMANVGAVRREVQVINTQKLYAKYQKHWNVSLRENEVANAA
jgi:hypothetical protein